MSVVQKNLAYVCRNSNARIIIRTPIIPGVTDAADCLSEIAGIMHDNNIDVIELLPMNPHTRHYYAAMGLEFPLGDTLPAGRARLEATIHFFECRGIEAGIQR